MRGALDDEDALRHGAKAEIIRTENGARSYVGRYVGKLRQKLLPPGIEGAGRWWGSSHSLKMDLRAEMIVALRGDQEFHPVALYFMRCLRRYLTNEEVAALVGMPEPYGFIARLGLGTGLRWGELVRAQSTDVQNGELVVHQTKSRKVRRVPLNPELQAELRMRVGLLVPLVNGWNFTQQARKLSGVARFHPHMMRHTFGTRWLVIDGSLAAFQEMLGHSSITTTQRYARLSGDMVRREAERVYSGQRG